MKIQQTTSTVQTSGLDTVTDFKIAVNGKAFRILLDGIYPNKIKAVIRELCTNAFDAHSAVGKRHIPFDVTIPSTFNPVFKVRDYGVSMAHDQVMHLYSTLFQSSKENTNTEVGMLGLGSKAPFAYADAFTTVAWLDGKKRTYRAWMGDNGVPKIAFLGEENSTEPQGIEVSIDVNTKDVGIFATTAKDILKYFSTTPNILNNPIDIKKDITDLSGNGWYLIKDGARTALARQGCVVYPINGNAIPNLSPEQTSMIQSPFVIDFPIGTLDVAPSREELSYNPVTCANIIARLNSIAQEISASYKREIDEAKTGWEASQIYLKISRSSIPQSVVKIISNYTWNGNWALSQTIKLQDAFKIANDIDQECELHYFDQYKKSARLDLTLRSSEEYMRKHLIAGESINIFVRTDLENKPTYEGMRLAQARTGGSALVLITKDQAAVDTFINFIGNPPYTHTKDLPAAIIQRSPTNRTTGKTKKTEIKVRQIEEIGSKCRISNEFVLPLDGEAYFIETKNSKPLKFTKNPRSSSILHQISYELEAAKVFKMLDPNLPIYFVSTLYVERITEHGKWVDLYEHVLNGLSNFKDQYIKDKVADQLDPNSYSMCYTSNILEYSSNPHLYKFTLSNPDSTLTHLFKQRHSIETALKAARDANSTAGFDSNLFHRLVNLYEFTVTRQFLQQWNEEAQKIVDANLIDMSALRTTLFTFYPMLEDSQPKKWNNEIALRYVEYIRSMDQLHELRKFVTEVNTLRNASSLQNPTGDNLESTFLFAAE